MSHIILLGDSIFDNARYVPDCPALIDQLRDALPDNYKATLLAVDGHITDDVETQLRDLPTDASHLVVSAGGNNALLAAGILSAPVGSVAEAMSVVSETRKEFSDAYSKMLRTLAKYEKPTVICTVYDSIPDLPSAEQAALAQFNETIIRKAAENGLPIIDLRLLCDQPADYSHVSPIEPSTIGGAKIARVIAEVVTSHDFTGGKSVIYR